MPIKTTRIVIEEIDTYSDDDEIYFYSSSRKTHKHTHKKSSAPSSTKTRRIKIIATEADLRKHNLPNNYETKYWDASLPPITFMRSVFDTESIIQWLYDWEVHYHKGNTFNSHLCSRLKEGFINLNKRVIKANNSLTDKTNTTDKELIQDFINSTKRIESKLQKILNNTVEYINQKIDKEGYDKSKNIAELCISIIFAEEYELQNLITILNNIETWTFRFDANVP